MYRRSKSSLISKQISSEKHSRLTHTQRENRCKQRYVYKCNVQLSRLRADSLDPHKKRSRVQSPFFSRIYFHYYCCVTKPFSKWQSTISRHESTISREPLQAHVAESPIARPSDGISGDSSKPLASSQVLMSPKTYDQQNHLQRVLLQLKNHRQIKLINRGLPNLQSWLDIFPALPFCFYIIFPDNPTSKYLKKNCK